MLALFGPLNLVSKIAGGFLVGALLLISLAYWNADRRADKFERQLVKATAELKRISSAKDQQGQVTKGNVEKAKVIYRDAERQAERIEKAPVSGRCETPEVIMGADL